MENFTKGDIAGFSRYTFDQNGGVVNKVTQKPIVLEGEGGKEYYRLTNDEGQRKVKTLNSIVEHFQNLQQNANSAEKIAEIKQENGGELPEGEVGKSDLTGSAPKKEKAEKAPKSPKAEKAAAPEYVPNPDDEPKKPGEDYKIEPLSNEKIRLTDDDVRQVRWFAWSGMPQKEIREKFNLHASTCSNIIRRKLHPNLDAPVAQTAQ